MSADDHSVRDIAYHDAIAEQYDHVALHAEDPDEAPIAIETLNAACEHAGLRRVYERRGWEIFPRRQPPGLIDRIGIRVLDRICPRNGPIYWAASVKA